MGQGAPDLSNYAKTDDLTTYAKTSDLTTYAKTSDLSNYVKATSLEDYAKRTALNEYIKTVDIPSNVPLQDNMKKVIGGDNNFQAAVRNLLVTDPTFNTSITKFISDNVDKFRGLPGVTQFGALTSAQKAEVITGLYNTNKISLVDELTGRDNFKTDIVNALARIESVRGATGTMGPIGVSVQSASLSGDNLSFALSNKSSLGPFNVRGPQGIQGEKGNTGAPGKDGSDYKDETAANWFKERVMWCADGQMCTVPTTGNLGVTFANGSRQYYSGELKVEGNTQTFYKVKFTTGRVYGKYELELSRTDKNLEGTDKGAFLLSLEGLSGDYIKYELVNTRGDIKDDITNNKFKTFVADISDGNDNSIYIWLRGNTLYRWKGNQIKFDSVNLTTESKTQIATNGIGQGTGIQLFDVNNFNYDSRTGVANRNGLVSSINNTPGFGSPSLQILRNIGSNDISATQHGYQFELGKQSDQRRLALGVMDDGNAVIQAKEMGVGYLPLNLNPIAGAVKVGQGGLNAPKFGSNFNLRGDNFKPQSISPSSYAIGFSDGGKNGYADTMIFNTWGDGSGGETTAVAIDKTGDINMRLYRGAQGATTKFSNYKDVVLQDKDGNVNVSGKLLFPAGTDYASIYIDGDKSNTNKLVFETGDDDDEPIVFRQRYHTGTTKDILTIIQNGVNVNGIVSASGGYFAGGTAGGGGGTHFPYIDGKNYIRGNTQHDGSLNVSGSLIVNGVNILDELNKCVKKNTNYYQSWEGIGDNAGIATGDNWVMRATNVTPRKFLIRD